VNTPTPCPRCGKVHKTLHPALLCLHAWQNDHEQRIGKENFTMDQYMAMQHYVQKLGG
jgi:hypothetical protein